MNPVFDMTAGWSAHESFPGLGRTSPGWYAVFNEMVLLQKFIESKGMQQEYQKYKEETWPAMEKGIKEKCKELRTDLFAVEGVANVTYQRGHENES